MAKAAKSKNNTNFVNTNKKHVLKDGGAVYIFNDNFTMRSRIKIAKGGQLKECTDGWCHLFDVAGNRPFLCFGPEFMTELEEHKIIRLLKATTT